MPTTKQRRQAARRRLARQLDRRRELNKRRRRNTIISLVVCAVLLVGGGTGFVLYQVLSDEDSASPTVRADLPARTPDAKQPRDPQQTQGPCGYAETAETLANPNTFDVGLPPDPDPTPNTGTVPVRLDTSQGDITLTLDRAKAPCTVQSLEYLIGSKFFDNTACPRSVNQGIFVLQCGDPTATTGGGPTYNVGDENLDTADYGAGVIAMANSGPNTNGSQFFFIFNDSNAGLVQDGQKRYTVVGTVSEGLDILQRVGEAGDDGTNQAGGGRPNEDVIIHSATLVQ